MTFGGNGGCVGARALVRLGTWTWRSIIRGLLSVAQPESRWASWRHWPVLDRARRSWWSTAIIMSVKSRGQRYYKRATGALGRSLALMSSGQPSLPRLARAELESEPELNLRRRRGIGQCVHRMVGARLLELGLEPKLSCGVSDPLELPRVRPAAPLLLKGNARHSLEAFCMWCQLRSKLCPRPSLRPVRVGRVCPR